jgi:hypothetical protein
MSWKLKMVRDLNQHRQPVGEAYPLMGEQRLPPNQILIKEVDPYVFEADLTFTHLQYNGGSPRFFFRDAFSERTYFIGAKGMATLMDAIHLGEAALVSKRIRCRWKFTKTGTVVSLAPSLKET